MKKLLPALITLLFFSTEAQIQLQQSFTSPFNVASSGWYIQNESSVTGSNSTTWYQGDPSYFAAYSGQSTDYFAADYFSIDFNSSGDISNWLITPTVTIYNGAQLKFMVRTDNTGSTNAFPDRMQVRMSTAGTASVIQSGPSSIGTFSTLLLDINPNLNQSTSSAVNNGSVNGFPNAWTSYSLTITGVTGTVAGRFAFRYYVPGGGPQGVLGYYVALDDVQYELPCSNVSQNYTICPGGSATLTAIGGLPPTTYSWSNGTSGNSISVNPASTTVYTLSTFNGTTSCGNPATYTVTIGSGLSIAMVASNTTICSGQVVTISAVSAATQYSWSNGSQASSIVVAPSTTTTYAVGGANANLSCFGTNSITIVVNTPPVLGSTLMPAPLCIGSVTDLTITVSGASTYSYLGVTSTMVALPSPTDAGTYNYDVVGYSAAGCFATANFTFEVIEPPVITAQVSNQIVCSGNTVQLSASGADSYVWAGPTVGTGAVFAVAAGATTGIQNYTVIGTSIEGCTVTATTAFSISACAGVTEMQAANDADVFPNPFSEKLQVAGFDGTITICSTIGQLAWKGSVKNDVAINTTALAPGVYVVTLNYSSGQTRTFKLLKQ